MTRPLEPQGNPPARHTIHLASRISPELYRRLLQFAKEKDWTISSIIRKALEAYIAANSNQRAA